MPNLTLPGYKYLGPGNPVNNGEPTDYADSVAQRHDQQYAAANSDSDIRASDREAIVGFLTDRNILGPSVAGSIGAIGIGAKYAAETVLGVQYPNMAEKREADSSMEPPMKISKGESSHSHHNGGTGATNFITTKETAKAAKQTFKKAFQIQGESLRWRRGQNSTAYCTSQGLNAATFQNKNWMIDTSMQVLDPNRMEWYMSPSEFKSLPLGSYATSCRIKVTHKGYRLHMNPKVMF